MYEDDGKSRTSISDGRFEILEFAADRSGDSLTIGLSRSGGEYDGMPPARLLTLVVHNWPSEVGSVTIGDAEVPLRRRLRRNGNSAVYDEGRKRLTIRVRWDHQPVNLTIN